MFPERILKTNASFQITALANTMKTNLAKRKFLRVFMRQIHGEHARRRLGLAISRLRKTKFENENILRWEDDGGQIGGWNNPVERLNPAATRVNKIMRVSSAAHFDAFNEKSEKQTHQAYKDEYLANDSPGG